MQRRRGRRSGRCGPGPHSGVAPNPAPCPVVVRRTRWIYGGVFTAGALEAARQRLGRTGANPCSSAHRGTLGPQAGGERGVARACRRGDTWGVKVLVIDNYDSFTYNLVQYLLELGARVDVVRNDAIDAQGVVAKRPDGVLLSPGPGVPERAGCSLNVVRAVAGRIPLLGVCLGHQSIAVAHGGRLRPARRLMHGKTSRIEHDGRGVFAGLPQGVEVMRYHSWVVDEDALPPGFEVTARAEDGAIMGLRVAAARQEGVQFHPESILTAHGKAMLQNWLDSLGAFGQTGRDAQRADRR